MDALGLLAQSTYNNNAGGGAGLFIFYAAFVIAAVAGLWKTFEKAGQPGWAAIIPIYNTYVLLKVAGRPVWWLLLFLIPFVNIVVSAVVAVDVAKAFDRSEIFGLVGLWLFAFVGYLMIGFGDDTYHAPESSEE